MSNGETRIQEAKRGDENKKSALLEFNSCDGREQGNRSFAAIADVHYTTECKVLIKIIHRG